MGGISLMAEDKQDHGALWVATVWWWKMDKLVVRYERPRYGGGSRAGLYFILGSNSVVDKDGQDCGTL